MRAHIRPLTSRKYEIEAYNIVYITTYCLLHFQKHVNKVWAFNFIFVVLTFQTSYALYLRLMSVHKTDGYFQIVRQLFVYVLLLA